MSAFYCSDATAGTRVKTSTKNCGDVICVFRTGWDRLTLSRSSMAVGDDQTFVDETAWLRTCNERKPHGLPVWDEQRPCLFKSATGVACEAKYKATFAFWKHVLSEHWNQIPELMRPSERFMLMKDMWQGKSKNFTTCETCQAVLMGTDLGQAVEKHLSKNAGCAQGRLMTADVVVTKSGLDRVHLRLENAIRESLPGTEISKDVVCSYILAQHQAPIPVVQRPQCDCEGMIARSEVDKIVKRIVQERCKKAFENGLRTGRLEAERDCAIEYRDLEKMAYERGFNAGAAARRPVPNLSFNNTSRSLPDSERRVRQRLETQPPPESTPIPAAPTAHNVDPPDRSRYDVGNMVSDIRAQSSENQPSATNTPRPRPDWYRPWVPGANLPDHLLHPTTTFDKQSPLDQRFLLAILYWEEGTTTFPPYKDVTPQSRWNAFLQQGDCSKTWKVLNFCATFLNHVFNNDISLALQTLKDPSVSNTTLLQLDSCFRPKVMGSKKQTLTADMVVPLWQDFRSRRSKDQQKLHNKRTQAMDDDI